MERITGEIDRRWVVNYGSSTIRIFERLKAIEDILGDSYELDRLRELALADRDGQCVVLPCELGSIVYLLCGNAISECRVLHYEVMPKSTDAILWNIGLGIRTRVDISCFDKKIIFTTRKGAEAAIGGGRE